jgi:hypothetical protein
MAPGSWLKRLARDKRSSLFVVLENKNKEKCFQRRSQVVFSKTDAASSRHLQEMKVGQRFCLL